MRSEFPPPMETPRASKLDALKAKIEAARDAHDFDVAKIGLENGEVAAVSELLDLSEKAQGFREPDFDWTEDDSARFTEARTKIEALVERLEGSSDMSDEGMLRAFLQNKITLLDLASMYAKRKRKG